MFEPMNSKKAMRIYLEKPLSGNPLANNLTWAARCIRKMIELPKPANAPGNLSESIFVTEAEVKQRIAGIQARRALRNEQFARFAERLERNGR